MKKRILKVFGAMFIMGLMVFNMQFLNTQGGSGLSLDGLINMAYASTEGGSEGTWGWQQKRTTTQCTSSSTTTTVYWMCNGVKYYSYQGSNCTRHEEHTTTTFTGVMTWCDDGSNFTCSERCVGEG